MTTKETYLPGYSANASNFMGFRTAQSHAAFLLPKLRPDLRLLDCGCGPGTITLGLARLVAPGVVIGMDLESAQLDRAREQAAKHDITNLRFETGSVYELPFPDASFDVVFAHALFEHLRDPLGALSEIRRVLVPGGLAALRSPDWGGFLVSPATQQLDAAMAYYQSLQTLRGGDPHVGRKFKTLLRMADFRDLEFSASYECYHSLELIGEYLAQGIERSSKRRQPVNGFAATLRNWSRCEDGIFAQSWCEIIGRK